MGVQHLHCVSSQYSLFCQNTSTVYPMAVCFARTPPPCILWHSLLCQNTPTVYPMAICYVRTPHRVSYGNLLCPNTPPCILWHSLLCQNTPTVYPMAQSALPKHPHHVPYGTVCFARTLPPCILWQSALPEQPHRVSDSYGSLLCQNTPTMYPMAVCYARTAPPCILWQSALPEHPHHVSYGNLLCQNTHTVYPMAVCFARTPPPPPPNRVSYGTVCFARTPPQCILMHSLLCQNAPTVYPSVQSALPEHPSVYDTLQPALSVMSTSFEIICSTTFLSFHHKRNFLCFQNCSFELEFYLIFPICDVAVVVVVVLVITRVPVDRLAQIHSCFGGLRWGGGGLFVLVFFLWGGGGQGLAFCLLGFGFVSW